MYKLYYSRKFKRDYKRIKKNSNFKLNKFEIILDILIDTGDLGNQFKNHRLKGIFQNCFDCHIQPDVLLVYKIYHEEKIINLLRIGSHSNLF